MEEFREVLKVLSSDHFHSLLVSTIESLLPDNPRDVVIEDLKESVLLCFETSVGNYGLRVIRKKIKMKLLKSIIDEKYGKHSLEFIFFLNTKASTYKEYAGRVPSWKEHD